MKLVIIFSVGCLILFNSCSSEQGDSYLKMNKELLRKSHPTNGYVNLLKFTLGSAIKPSFERNHLVSLGLDCKTKKDRLGVFVVTTQYSPDEYQEDSKMTTVSFGPDEFETIEVLSFELEKKLESDSIDRNSSFYKGGYILDLVEFENRRKRNDSTYLRVELYKKETGEKRLLTKGGIFLHDSYSRPYGIQKYEANRISDNEFFNLYHHDKDSNRRSFQSTFVVVLYNSDDYEATLATLNSWEFKRIATSGNKFESLLVPKTNEDYKRRSDYAGFAFGEDGSLR